MSSLQTAETTGRVEDGQLTISNGDRATLEAGIRHLPTGEYSVRVSRLAGTRTASANAQENIRRLGYICARIARWV